MGAQVTFEATMENIAKAFEVVGVGIIVIGGLVAMLVGLKDFRSMNRFFGDARRGFGRPLILGLEVLVAADIIKTITVEATIESAVVLGILVAVRISLSFSLDIEVDGMLPWRRVETDAKLKAAGLSKPDEN